MIGQPWSFVVTAEHGGNVVPPEYSQLFVGADEALASHRGWDPGSLALAHRLASSLRASLVSSTVTRLVVDLNRSPHHPRVFSEFTRSLKRSDRSDLIARWHAPHRVGVREAVEAEVGRGRRALHIGVHSFTPVLHGVPRTPDIALLYDPARPAELNLARLWSRALAKVLPDLAVRRNDPYRGVSDGLTTSLRRTIPADAYLGFEIEINQRLLDADGQFPRSICAALVETLWEGLTPLG